MRGKTTLTVQHTKTSMFCEVPDAISLDLWTLTEVNLDTIPQTEPIVGWTLFKQTLFSESAVLPV